MLTSFDDLFKMNCWLKSGECWQMSTSQGSTVVITTCWHSFQQFQKGYRELSTQWGWIILSPLNVLTSFSSGQRFLEDILVNFRCRCKQWKNRGNNWDGVATAETKINSSGPLVRRKQWEDVGDFSQKCCYAVSVLLVQIQHYQSVRCIWLSVNIGNNIF